MSAGVVGLVLVAAVLHAGWNALLHGGGDQLRMATLMSIATAVIALPFALLLPLPDRASWPYLLISAAVQVLYILFLVRVYRVADLGSVYPVIRGSVPLFVTLGATIAVGEQLSPPMLLGIGLVSFGTMAMLGGKDNGGLKAMTLAVVTGGIIALYTVIDGVGARLAGNPHAYTAWIFLVFGVLMPAAFVALRGISPLGYAPELHTAVLAGVIQILTYAVVIWAFTLSPLGPISALRQTSVVAATLIGWRFRGESLSALRLGACAVILAGAALLS
ncbi:hypothetical protein [Nocardia sp. CDC160]|uniref:hypothetical protein n=1 Tax=Nocardia sp. CDC160 TaxID=3112166 RepID=UPI002DBF4961|nr:hypothetical protein [Nocardia sp. CDC160]MEC3916075.1 hypothetical protein [Nocardia sp. CDC160]